MAETTTAETAQVPRIEDLIGRLQENMRIYDELLSVLLPHTMKQEELNQELERRDLEFARSAKMEEIAFMALDKVIIDRKCSDIAKQISELENSDTDIAIKEFLGISVAIQALHPEVEGVQRAPFWGKTKTEGTGRLINISLNPRDGGFIAFGKNFLRDPQFEAGPLVIRGGVGYYEPLFSLSRL